MPGLCCGSTGASVLAVSIDGYVRLFLPWLTFEARARAQFLTRCLLLVAALAARGQAAPAETRRACTSSTSRRCRWPSAAALHRQHRTFRAVRQRAGRGQALARVAGHYGGIGAAADAGRFRACRRATARRTRSRSPPWRRPRRAGRDAGGAAALLRQAAGRRARCFAATRMCARAATARRSACGSATAARCGACACWIPRVRPSATSC